MKIRHRPRVVLDANVLYRASIRDFLMHLSYVGFLFEPLWSDEIHEEWISNLLKNRPDLKRENLESVRNAMNRAAPHANIKKTAYENLTKTLDLPDQNDCHVLAVAIVGRADYIVTSNLQDFPNKIISHYGVAVLDPDSFLFKIVSSNLEQSILSLEAQKKNLIKNPRSLTEILDTLSNHGIPVTANFLKKQI